MSRNLLFRLSLLLVLLVVPSLSRAQGRFPEAHDQAPPDWSGDEPFRLRRQHPGELCGDLSGEVVSSFVTQFPRTDTPEPNAP